MIKTRAFLILGLCLALGLAIFGMQIGKAVRQGREFDRYLTVRGLSEVEVKANLAIWSLRFSVQANELAGLKGEMEKARAKVRAFLLSQGIAEGEINAGLPMVDDRELMKSNGEHPDIARYTSKLTIVVRSGNVDTVKAAMQQVDRLLEQGVALSFEEYGDRAQFLFTNINEVKPGMIAEATANARASAEKFAQDSKSHVGRIRKATQGVLEIDERDAASPERKILRVVTTVEFFLE